jgi:bacterioferritin (cytochrome b1)
VKGNEKLLTVLNQLLADELTAINQYMEEGHVDWADGLRESSDEPD